MTNYWNVIKNKLLKEDGIISVGFSDIVGSGIAAVFLVIHCISYES